LLPGRSSLQVSGGIAASILSGSPGTVPVVPGVLRYEPGRGNCSRWRQALQSGLLMGKRMMVALVGAGIGSLLGLLVSFLGVGNWALIGGAVVGAVIPLMVLGAPGR
jgi:hypothetical protein